MLALKRLTMRWTLGFVLQACWLATAWAHGRLIDPPSRSTMWRYGFNNPPNYDDNQLYCGGVQIQYEQNGGKCGICGDPWNSGRPNEPPGRYANGNIVRKYSPGEIITVVIELTANHKGWMEFKLCPNDDPKKRVTQECLDKYTLPLAETRFKRYTVPNKNGYQKIRVNLVLPSDVKCKSCVFQWKYNAGNSWGTDAVTGRGCIGCGNQEQFYGCADIAIGHDDVFVGPHRTPLPADIPEEEDNDLDNNNNEEKIPDITEWHWTARPNVPPDWESNSDKQTNLIHQGSKTFSFMPVMNNNGMNPCMCVCKRAPLKLKGGGNDLEAKFFDGLDGQDNQVCMCMCQNSARGLDNAVPLLICAFIVVQLFQRWLRH